jgi:hypothetical protein
MNSFAKTFSLSACALAASVLISACGGGSATDSVAPTATVTSAASTTAGAPAGTKTFTFVFSESVGSSFSVEDLVVTDGTPSNFTKVSATNYTVDVTPTGAATPTVTLPVGKVFDSANNANSVAFTPAAPAPTEPTTAAVAPTALAANVISIYSDAYTSVAGTDFFPNWGQSSVVSDFSAAGNATKKVSSLNYQGIALAAPIDVSTMGTLHIDVWSAASGTLNIGIITSAAINGGAALEKQLPQTLVSGWNSFDIPLSSFTSPTPNLTKIDQLILVGSGTIYYDNLYFWKAPTIPVSCGTTEPTCAPTTVIPAGATTIYSEASSTAGFNAFPNWGQATQYSEVTLASNKSLKYSNLNYEGIEFTSVDVSTKGKLHLDVWSAAGGTLNVGIVTSAAISGGGALETQVPQTLVSGWNSLDIPLTSFTAPNKTKIDQLIFVGSGTIFVDNIYFWDTATAGGGGGSTPNPTADMGSGGAVTLPVATVGDAFGFVVPGDGVFASDYIGAIDANNNHASWTNAVTSGNGNIGYFNDPAMDSAAQKLDANGWIGSGLDNPGGVPNFFRYFVFTGTAAPFANSYMGLYANSPNNGVANVSSFGNIKLKLWGPAEMYQQSNFNPPVELILTGPKVAGCTATGSGGTEISKTFTANQKIGAGSTYKIPLAAWTVKGVCGTDTNATAVSAVLGGLARVVVNVPGSSFNFTNASANSNPAAYATGVNLGPIAFTNN